MDVIDVAKELGVDPKNVRRYINKGRLHATKQKINSKEFKYIIEGKDLGKFILIEESYNKLKADIKEIYSLNICGASEEEIMNEFNYFHRKENYRDIHKFEILHAIEKHKRIRERRLNYCGIKDHAKVFTPGEVCARLSITDTHIVHQLVKTGELKKIDIKIHLSPFGKNVFVSVDSIIHYLGTDKTTRFYTSKNTSIITGRTVNQIDRIALYYGIGRKIKKNNKNSIYLFSNNDISNISRLKKPNG